MLKRVLTAMVAMNLAALGAGCGGGGGTAARPSACADGPMLVTPAVEVETAPLGVGPVEAPAKAAAGPAEAAAGPAEEKPKAAPSADAGRAAELVKQLGDDDFQKREAASAELEKIGAPAVPALKKAKESPDLEVARRAEAVLAKIENRTAEATAPDMPGTARALRGNRGARTGVRIQMGEGVRIIGGQINMQNVRSVRTEEGTATISESNGSITLVLKPKEGEARTFSAPTKAEFKEKFPKLYKQYIDPNN